MEPLQNQLFFECIEDAMETDIKALGGPKKVAAIFFADKTTEQGAAIIRAWVNPDRNERPSPSQLLLLKKKAREVGSWAVISHECQQLGIKFEWVAPEDQRDQLQRDFIQAAKYLKGLGDQLSRIEEQETRLRSVR